MSTPRLSFWSMWNMSFGFLGIQFGWGLQMANMSAIYEYLGAEAHDIPMLWLAAPLTGLLVQPVIGHLSDRTWGRLGRRRPYFLAGALLSSTALLLMPSSSALWMAAGLLWILDASINISMEPFRAFVADLLPEEQRTRGFAMQSLFIGLGAVLASALPWVLANAFGVNGADPGESIPRTAKWSFYAGAVAFLGCVLWTIVTTREYPPEDLEAFRRERASHRGLAEGTREIFGAVRAMPETMRQLALVQVFTWLGLFCMWMFFGLATAQQIFHTTDAHSAAFDEGTAFGGRTFAWYSIVCFLVAFVLPLVARATSRKTVHALALIAGGASLLTTFFIHDKTLWQLTMLGVGIAWASILSMPYAMLAGALPAERVGVYMGIFNFFIVIPEILASLALEPVVKNLFGNDPVKVVMLGGAEALSVKS